MSTACVQCGQVVDHLWWCLVPEAPSSPCRSVTEGWSWTLRGPREDAFPRAEIPPLIPGDGPEDPTPSVRGDDVFNEISRLCRKGCAA